MARLTRAQRQERTRAAVLAAARDEFAEHGYADAKVDRIAERAELTRGAVYSNFPSKRALYLAVLVHQVEEPAPATSSPADQAAALGAFARGWLERLPLAGDAPADGRLRLRSLTGVVDDEPAAAALESLTRLEAQLLAFAVESLGPPGRRVRLAQLVLTLLTGAGQLPGFGDPFDVARACEQLAGIDLADAWAPPHLPFVAPAESCRAGWTPPSGLTDLLTGGPVALDAAGVVAVLGTGRLAAVEEAVRGARPGDAVTVAAVTSDPAELGRLVRLRLGDLAGCLRRVFVPDGRLRVVLDDAGVVAAAAGLAEVGDDTEAAVRVRSGEVVARASGRGAGHAVAVAASVPL